MRGCRLCRSSNLRFVTDFGKLVVTNQFIEPGGSDPFRQSISWLECHDCGVVQLAETPPIEQIRPRFPWLAYQEPDRHLGQSAEDLLRVGGLASHHRVFGLSHEEWPLLKRLEGPQAQVLDPVHDLGITLPRYGRETIQSKWTVECARRAKQRYGAADTFIALYSLEHAHDGAEFLAACREFLAPGGILLVEVPDCSRAFRDVDVTVVWEEHTMYFTEESLEHGLTEAGFDRLHFRQVPGLIEDQLVWIGKSSSTPTPRIETSDGTAMTSDVEHFGRMWPLYRDACRSWAAGINNAGGKLAVFGAGHRTCTLIDLMGIGSSVDCVIDDSPDKQQLRFPAGGLPICGSSALIDRKITVCLLAVNPEVEDRIVNRNSEFLARGGIFVSCYPRVKNVGRERARIKSLFDGKAGEMPVPLFQHAAIPIVPVS